MFLPIRTLARHGHAIRARVIELPMSAHDRRRVRRLVEAPDGTRLALELPTGTVLHPGQVIYEDDERSFVVAAANEDVLVIAPRDIAEAARIAHLIGNLHRDIEITPTEIVALADHTLAERLENSGVPFQRAERPFHGRAPGEHAH